LTEFEEHVVSSFCVIFCVIFYVIGELHMSNRN
jgi:hypothetical protein